jgi:hypothetical protein
MMRASPPPAASGGPPRLPAPDLELPVALAARYLFFLARRPISRSNVHYLEQRLLGLRALAPLLARRGRPVLDRAAAELAHLSPASFRQRAPQLLADLVPLAVREVPRDVVLSGHPPDRSFLDPVRRVLVVMGPAIGVGDEILCAGIPRRLWRRLPEAEITLLSAYRALWERLGVAHRAVCYETHAELLAALRGDGPDGAADLVVLADFEKPDLVPAIAREARLARYVEVALGAPALAAFDGARRWLHQLEGGGAGFQNHYATLDRFLAWLGAPDDEEEAGGATVGATPARARAAVDGEAVFLVSPFTSKQEPSLVYWSRLLAALLPAAAAPRARLLLDPGPNVTTERFALTLAEAVRAAAPPGLRVELARGGARRHPSLADLLETMREADVVVASDSFAAHAAPLFACAALIVAPPGLEAWRVPAPRSFYFQQGLAPEAVAVAMQQALGAAQLLDGALPRPWLSAAARRAVEAGRRLAAALPDGDEVEAFYAELGQAYRGLLAELPEWPPAAAALLGDVPYAQLLPPAPPAPPRRPEDGDDLREHLAARWAEWRGSNLGKLLELLVPAEQALAPPAALRPVGEPAGRPRRRAAW